RARSVFAVERGACTSFDALTADIAGLSARTREHQILATLISLTVEAAREPDRASEVQTLAALVQGARNQTRAAHATAGAQLFGTLTVHRLRRRRTLVATSASRELLAPVTYNHEFITQRDWTAAGHCRGDRNRHRDAEAGPTARDFDHAGELRSYET